MEYKKYLVFAGPHYYPNGGIDDLYGVIAYHEIDECSLAIEVSLNYQWYHIVDGETFKKIKNMEKLLRFDTENNITLNRWEAREIE